MEEEEGIAAPAGEEQGRNRGETRPAAAGYPRTPPARGLPRLEGTGVGFLPACLPVNISASLPVLAWWFALVACRYAHVVFPAAALSREAWLARRVVRDAVISTWPAIYSLS